MAVQDPSRQNYLPFGETLNQSGALPRERFTGQERDGEAGMDYFRARNLLARTGRMNAPDPLIGDAVTNPQRWNRYIYALDNPFKYTDRSGKTPDCVTSPPAPGLIASFTCPKGPVQGIGDQGAKEALGDLLYFGTQAVTGGREADEPAGEGGGSGLIVRIPDSTQKFIDEVNAAIDRSKLPKWLKWLLYISPEDLVGLNAGSVQFGKMKVKEILKLKNGGIRSAPLEKGTPSWESILDKTLDELIEQAKDNPSIDTIIKLLKDSRFNRKK